MDLKKNSKNNLDTNLKETIKIFEDHHIDYWICHGTLLGIIRDDELIPWDHDIDIAVWDNQEIKNKIKNLMLSNFFNLKDKFLIKDDLLTFTKEGGREIDINFYKFKGEGANKIAYIEWFVPKNNFLKLIDALSKAKSYNGKYKKIINKLYLFEDFFKILKMFLIRKNFFFKSMGYTQPFDYLNNFKKDII